MHDAATHEGCIAGCTVTQQQAAGSNSKAGVVMRATIDRVQAKTGNCIGWTERPNACMPCKHSDAGSNRPDLAHA